MGRVNTPILTDNQHVELERELKTNHNHSLRMYCQAILLKASGRKSKDVAQIVGMCHVSVNSWLKRFKTDGLQGLRTKPGRGRKPLLDKVTDKEAILAVGFDSRQRIQLAKADWQAAHQESSRPVSASTFRTFLKTLVGPPMRDYINEFADG